MTTGTRSLLLAGLAISLLPSKGALAAPVLLSLEPIIGYERVQKIVPDAHTHDRLLYGARLTLGFMPLAAEAEYTRATDSESFSSPDLKTKDTDDRLKLGLRSSIPISRIFSFQLRGGGQALRNVHSETTAGVTSEVKNKIHWDPYGGAGLTARLGSRVLLSAGVTAVFTDFPHMSKNDYQTNVGFSLRFP